MYFTNKLNLGNMIHMYVFSQPDNLHFVAT